MCPAAWQAARGGTRAPLSRARARAPRLTAQLGRVDACGEKKKHERRVSGAVRGDGAPAEAD